jgi:hypothetical protein
MTALVRAYILGRVDAMSDCDKWRFSDPRTIDAEWPAWVNGPSALLEAYSLGLNERGHRALVNLEQSLRKPPNIVILHERDKEAAGTPK